MFAIVEIAGLQYKVEQDQKLYVNRLQGEKGAKVTFDKVLLTQNGTTTVGAPAVKGVSVTAEILDHLKADKVIIFKKKRRKGYRVKNGHRQPLTQIQITDITGFDKPAKVAKKVAPKAEVKEAAKVAETASVAKKAAVAKVESKKSEVKNQDYATVNFSEDHELNYHLKKHNLSSSKENRTVLTKLGDEFKENEGKKVLSHEDVDAIIDQHIAEFKSLNK